MITSRQLALLLGLLVTMLGAAVLAGWALEVEALKTVFPGLVTMKANTALALILCGAALALLARPQPGKIARGGAAGLAAVVIAIGALTLAQYFGGWDLHLDQALFHDSYINKVSTSSPGRMAPISALSFVFLGLAIGMAARPSPARWRPPAIIALVAGVGGIGAVAFFGCLLKLATGSLWWDYTGLAVHTAVGFILLGVGLLAWLKSERGLTWLLGARATGGFVLAVALMVTIAGASFGFTSKLREWDAWVSHTHEVLKEIQDVATDVMRLQSEQRGYLILGDAKLLERYAQARESVWKNLADIHRLTVDNLAQQQRVEQLRPLIAQRIAWSEENIATYQRSGFAAVQQRIQSGTGIELANQIIAVIQAMEDEENRLLLERQAQAGSLAPATFLLLPLGVFFSLTLLFLGMSLLNADVAARQQAEEALRESEARLLKMFMSCPVGVAIHRWSDRTFVDINAAFTELTGWTREEVIGRTTDQMKIVESKAATADLRTRLTAHATLRNAEMTIKTRAGEPRFVLLSTDLVELRGETHAITTFVDITERKHAEERAVWLATFPERNPNPILEVDLAGGVFQYLNSAARRQFPDLEKEGLCHPLVAGLQEAMEELTTQGTLRREVAVSGQFFSQVITYIAEARRVRVYSTDITERRQAEEAMRKSEEHFRFLDQLSEATRTLADPGQIMAEMARMLGTHLGASRCAYADVEPDGEAFTILHDYTDGCASTVGHYQLSLFGPSAAEAMHGGQTLIIRHVESELSSDKGVEMFRAIGIQAIICCPLVKGGTLRAMMAVHQTTPRDWQLIEIATVQDVVERCWASIERRTAEEKIRQLNAELEQRVIERTTQLEVANKELEAFSYSVSHDLRAPLRAVDGFSQAVLEDYGTLLPAEGQRYLETIRGGAQRMGNLIDDLLTFARLSRAPLSQQPVDPARLVREVWEDLAPQREGRPVEFHCGELPPCAGDSALLKQVWVNLLSNALKYSRKRSPAVIEIGTTTEAEETAYFVRDNGTGFDMRYAGKLFGVFQRLHRAEEFEGTGVGLAIVQRVVHRHGGKVWAKAEVDRGATFFFTLPRGTTP